MPRLASAKITLNIDAGVVEEQVDCRSGSDLCRRCLWDLGRRADLLCLGRVCGSAGNSHAPGAVAISLVLLITVAGHGNDARGLSRRALLFLMATASLLSINWLTFIWAIQAQRIADASLGYFINPLVNVLLGGVFLRERLRLYQWLAVAVALLGVGAELGCGIACPGWG